MPISATRRPPSSPSRTPSCPSRPRTSQGSERRLLSARQAVGKEEARPGEYEIELLEYEWPDLPPIPKMKDAIARSRVSHGISYLLPVDKGKNSINNRFRTDLRAMFQEPYASDDLRYDDSRVKLSAKVHFKSNSADTKWTQEHLQSLPVELNSDSEQVRKLYTRSAPSSDSASRRMGIDPCKLRKRSNLYLPIKAKVPPEAIKIRKEVEKIIKSVQEDDGEYHESDHVQVEESDSDATHNLDRRRTLINDEIPHNLSRRRTFMHDDFTPNLNRRRTLIPGDSVNLERRKTLVNDDSVDGNQSLSSLTLKFQKIDSPYGKQHFDSYDELRSAKPPRILIPERFKSEHLSDEKNQEIWDWLHEGEELTDFQYFLSVCG